MDPGPTLATQETTGATSEVAQKKAPCGVGEGLPFDSANTPHSTKADAVSGGFSYPAKWASFASAPIR